MPHSTTTATKRPRSPRAFSDRTHQNKSEPRYTVGLDPALVRRVERYAEKADMSMSKAIATLARLGLESQADRKRAFFSKLKQNLSNDDPKQQDRLVDEFRALILGQ